MISTRHNSTRHISTSHLDTCNMSTQDKKRPMPIVEITTNSRTKTSSQSSKLTTTTTSTETTYTTKPGPRRDQKQFMYKRGMYYIIQHRSGAQDSYRADEVKDLWGEIFLEECDKVAKRQQLDYCKARGYPIPDRLK